MKILHIKEIPSGLFAVTGLAQGLLVGIYPCYKVIVEFLESNEVAIMVISPIILIALMAISMAIFYIVNSVFGICVNLLMKISTMSIAVNFYESSELRPVKSKFAVKHVKDKEQVEI